MTIRSSEVAWLGRAVVTALALFAFGCAPAAKPAVPARSAARVEAPVESKPVPAPDPLEEWLRGDPALAPWLDDAERRRVQVFLTVPNEDKSLRRAAFRGDAEYFYPASSIKICTAFASLDKLEELHRDESDSLSPSSPLRFVYGQGRKRRVIDTTLRREIEQSLAISSNDAFNHLLDFVGPEELAERLARRNITSGHIVQHLGEVSDGVPPMIEMRVPGRAPITIGHRLGFAIPPGPSVSLGRAYRDARGRLVQQPMDFSSRNAIRLSDLQDLLIGIVLPETTPHPEDWLPTYRPALLEMLRLRPSEMPGVSASNGATLDALFQPLTVALASAFPEQSIRVYGKGGRAYGFAIENTYVVDEATGRSFFLAATIYANENEIFNDDRYEYATVADPFLTRLVVVLAEKLLKPRS